MIINLENVILNVSPIRGIFSKNFGTLIFGLITPLLFGFLFGISKNKKPIEFLKLINQIITISIILFLPFFGWIMIKKPTFEVAYSLFFYFFYFFIFSVFGAYLSTKKYIIIPEFINIKED